MISYVGLILLLVSTLCHGMDEDYVPSGKRGMPISHSDQSWASDKEGDKKLKLVPKKSAHQKGKFFIINLEDTSQVNAFEERPAIIKSYMRQVAKKQGYTAGKVTPLIEAHLQAQDLEAVSDEELKEFFMQCPDSSCNAVLQSDKQKELSKYTFRHWFLTQQHQPQLYNDIAGLIAEDYQGALDLFGEHGLPKSRVVPLPALDDPMDEGDDEELDLEQQDDYEEQLEDVNPHEQVADVPVDNAQDHLGPWYIVDINPHYKASVIAFEAPTREQVMAHFLASKVPYLSLESQEVQEQGRAYRVHEELVKQLLVQEKKACKSLVCPDERCEVMISEEGQPSEEGLVQLFAQMALHHMQTHPIEQDNVLARKAALRAASSFEKAHGNMIKYN